MGATHDLPGDAKEDTLHELKNHVHVIAMGVQMVLDEAAELSKHHRDFLRAIDDRCDELVRLMQKLGTRLPQRCP